MSKSELKRQCVMNPLEMAERITELTNKLSAAELTAIRVSSNLGEAKMQLRNVDVMLAKERQAGRDEYQKELSEKTPDFVAFESCGVLSEKQHAHNDRLVNLIIQPPKEQS